MNSLRIVVPLLLVICLIAIAVARSRFTLAEHERLVVFRMGRPADMRGPGTVWILPFLESGVRLNAADSFEAKRLADYRDQLDRAAASR